MCPRLKNNYLLANLHLPIRHLFCQMLHKSTTQLPLSLRLTASTLHTHSSEIRGLCLMKWPIEMLINGKINFSGFSHKRMYIKYGKFWSVSLGHFIKHKPLISEECTGFSSQHHINLPCWFIMNNQKTSSADDPFKLWLQLFWNDLSRKRLLKKPIQLSLLLYASPLYSIIKIWTLSICHFHAIHQENSKKGTFVGKK